MGSQGVAGFNLAAKFSIGSVARAFGGEVIALCPRLLCHHRPVGVRGSGSGDFLALTGDTFRHPLSPLDDGEDVPIFAIDETRLEQNRIGNDEDALDAEAMGNVAELLRGAGTEDKGTGRVEGPDWYP